VTGKIRWTALLIIAAGGLAYGNSLSGPFVFDDTASIAENPALHSLRAIREVLSPAVTSTLMGRPLVNLTFAVNYALGGLDVRGYHLANLAIHLLAALTLFGVVRRTLLTAPLRARFGPAALPLAGATALLWTVHPLQTEAVTYIVQRAESLASLLYLLTLYGLIRSAEARDGRWWRAASVAACLLGTASKEILASAPLIALLYDRTFLAGSFREAFRVRGRYYLALALSWLLLASLVLSTGNRGNTAGFGVGVDAWRYGLTQLVALPHYLRLVLWPSPLVFDYGDRLAAGWREAAAFAPIVLALVALTVLSLRKHPAAGFLGVFFFAVLAPSSSFIPVRTQTMAEHRMYLPLAAVLTFLVAGLWAVWERLRARGAAGLRAQAPRLCVFAAAALVCTGLTLARNRDYRSAIALWQDTVEKNPGNWRAHYNLGFALAEAGDDRAALDQVEAALRLTPAAGDARVELKLALLLVTFGRVAEATTHYEKALAITPDDWPVRSNLGLLLLQQGRAAEAVPQFERALKLAPDDAKTRYNLGQALIAAGNPARGIEYLQEAVRNPAAPVLAYKRLADALLATGRIPEAAANYRFVLNAANLEGNAELAREMEERLARLR
jgi:Flp pilus assembly protein TadD